MGSCTLNRKASKVCFDGSADSVIYVDKNGDVYRFNFKLTSEENKPVLVLGKTKILMVLGVGGIRPRSIRKNILC